MNRQRIEAVFAHAGLTKYLGDVMPDVVDLPARISMTIANGQESLQSDTLTLQLIGTTEPMYEGIPAEMWQRLLYTSGSFHRQ